MKIEKINDSQIRCYLSGEDLAKRQLKLSELAYGSEKAKKLFQDLMQQAAFQFGFDAENIPLMIEAIPLPAGSIVLIVTKVENPEELDTRFSSFGPSVQNGRRQHDETAPSAFEQLINALRLGLGGSPAAPSGNGHADTEDGTVIDAGADAIIPDAGPARAGNDPEAASMERFRSFLMTHRLYAFDGMASVIKAAAAAGASYDGTSSLYHDGSEDIYYLFLGMEDTDAVQNSRRALAALSEYGRLCMVTPAREQHLMEHCTTVIAENALQALSEV